MFHIEQHVISRQASQNLIHGLSSNIILVSQDSAVRQAPAKTGTIGTRILARPRGYDRPSSERSSKSDRSSRSTNSYSQDEQTSCEEPANACTNERLTVGEDVINLRTRIVSVETDNSMQRLHDPAISLRMCTTTTSRNDPDNDECLGRFSPGAPDHLGSLNEMSSNPNSELDPASYPTSTVTNEWGPMQSQNSSRRRLLADSEAAEGSNATVSLSSEREEYFSTTCKSYTINLCYVDHLIYSITN